MSFGKSTAGGETDFAQLMPEVARALLGDPQERLVSGEWRYGSRGSIKIDSRAGTWFDFENNEGGGVLDLLRRQGIVAPVDWLRDQGLLSDKRFRREVGAYDYRDESGALLFQVVRFEPKDFRQRRPDGKGGWTWKLGGTRRVLYRLPELIAAVKADRTAYLVEGEKDADALVKIGLDATTNPGGVGKWRNEYSKFLRGADVIIVPDNDAAGREHADVVAASLRGIAGRIRVLDIAKHWPGCPNKGDISDWLSADGSAAKLKALVDAQPEATAGVSVSANNGLSKRKREPTEPRPDPRLLDDVYDFVGRFVAYPSEHARVGHVLWIAHTHAMDAWESTPRLAFLSPEPASGKTRALEISELLVPNPVEAINVTPAYLFRKVGDEEKGPPTLLYDEIDTVFGPKAKENEEIRGLLNAGHRRGAVAGRCVVHGKKVETEEIPAYCAVALAGLGWLPDTILTRSVIIRMRRRAPGEPVTPFRRRVYAAEGQKLQRRLATWAAGVVDAMAAARPDMPPGIEDRDADVWEPLLAIADAAGGHWPKRAREAAAVLVGAAKEAEPSLGVRLLADLKTVFDKRGEDKLATSVILADLIALPESPWGDLKGKPITDRALATRLRQYGIKSRDVFAAGKGLKGYYREDLHDAWLRYLPPSPPQKRDERDEGDDPSEMAGFHTTNIALIADSMRDELPERDGNTSMQSSNLAVIAVIADAQGGGEEKPNNTSPDDPGPIPEFLRRHPGRRCDHCGSELGIMNAWDRPGRPDGIWLHPRCEEAWHDAESASARKAS